MSSHHAAGLAAFLGGGWRNRQLIMALVRRDIASRYRGSLLGIAWAFLNPLAMLAVYTVVFGVFLGASWGDGGSKLEYALGVFCGILAFSFFAECMGRASGLVLNNKNYVKKIVFPLEIMAWVSVISAGAGYLAGFFFLVIFSLVIIDGVNLAVFWIPVLMLPMLMGSIGLSWFFSALCVYLRDLKQIIGSFVTMMMFLSGVFYSVERIPYEYQSWFKWNPLVILFDQMRAALLHGKWPDPDVFGALILGGFLMAWVGFAFFQKVRRGFADVI